MCRELISPGNSLLIDREFCRPTINYFDVFGELSDQTLFLKIRK